MPVSDDYLQFLLDQLKGLGVLRVKRMFGGAGIYCDELFFAIVADDRLYLKVDDSNRPDFEGAAMEPFKPFPDKPPMRGYWEVPVQVLEDRERLCRWAVKAIEVADRASAKAKRKKKRSPGK